MTDKSKTDIPLSLKFQPILYDAMVEAYWLDCNQDNVLEMTVLYEKYCGLLFNLIKENEKEAVKF